MVLTRLDEDGAVHVLTVELAASAPKHTATLNLDDYSRMPQVSVFDPHAYEPKQKAQWKRERQLGRRRGRR